MLWGVKRETFSSPETVKNHKTDFLSYHREKKEEV